MSFGLEVWNAGGVKTLSFTDQTALLSSIVDVSFGGSAGSSFSRNYSHLGSRLVILSATVDYGKRFSSGVNVTISGATVSVNFTTGKYYTLKLVIGVIK